MNKQELIKKYEETIYAIIATDEVLKDLKQLDEPQKPVVPQFVADWYEEHKDDLEFNMWDWIKYTQEKEKVENRRFTEWLGESENTPAETLIKMKLYGYTVEKEKKYIVRINNVFENANCLNHSLMNERWIFMDSSETDSCKTKHTREELEQAGFGWVFECPGIEIEEVEE